MRRFATVLFLVTATFLVLSRGSLQYTLLVVTTGTVLLGLSLLFPNIECQERADIGWDLVGWLVTLVFIWTLSAQLTRPALAYLLRNEEILKYHELLAQAPPWLLALGYLLVSDCVGYWAHRCLHGRSLWSTHAWHHSPTYLYWLAGSRTTLVHVLFIFVIPTLIASIALPVHHARDYMSLSATILMFNEQLVHTNLKVPFARLVEFVFVTPRFHFVHHSADRAHSDTNFGALFTFWDRMFGTYTNPDKMERDYPLGLNYKVPKWRLLVGIPPVDSSSSVTSD